MDQTDVTVGGLSGVVTPQAPTDPADFWLPVLVVFLGNFLFFFWCQYKEDNSFIDVMWGITFITPQAAILFKRAF